LAIKFSLTQVPNKTTRGRCSDVTRRMETP